MSAVGTFIYSSPGSTGLTDPVGGGRMAAGTAKAFSYEFRPQPDFAKDVRVTFGMWDGISPIPMDRSVC